MSASSIPDSLERRGSKAWLKRTRSRCDAFLTVGAFSSEEDSATEPNPGMLAEVERALTDKWFAGTFSDAIEERFRRATTDIRNRLIVRVLLMGLLLYDLFLPVDAFVIPDVLVLALVLHLGVGTPAGIIALVWVKRRPSKSPDPVHGVLLVIVATTLVVFASSRSPHADLIGCTFGLMTLSANTGVILTFRPAVLLTGVIDLAASVTILLHPSLGTASKLFCILLTFGVSFYAVLGAYRIEAGMRRAYLLALRESLRAKVLASANLQLRGLVDVDALTGIGNRRHFDATLARLSQSDVTSLALVMLDIDHFKGLNDRFGHQAGDACLRAVGALMNRECGGGGTTVTRYGGEEFALLIEEAGIDDAVRTAERLRLAITHLRLPIGADGDWVDVTASLGCASMRPGPSAASDLVADADAALYLAKRNGRNRTEAASARAADVPCYSGA